MFFHKLWNHSRVEGGDKAAAAAAAAAGKASSQKSLETVIGPSQPGQGSTSSGGLTDEVTPTNSSGCFGVKLSSSSLLRRHRSLKDRGSSSCWFELKESSLNTVDILRKKKNGEKLTEEEIQFLIGSVVNETILEVQIGALLMAIYLRGLNNDETFYLTSAISTSGNVIQWPETWKSVLVDKHSTGGIGDKISLILAPTLAVCGLKIPMILSRTLGIIGCTLDKMESIPGIRVDRSLEEIQKCLNGVGCCIVGDMADLAPANTTLNRFREVTATLDSPALFVATMIARKAAQGVHALVLDVKYGSGTIMKTKEDARSLAYQLVNMGYKMNIKTSAILSSMDIPIGCMIGNALEVAEAINCLKGEDKRDVKELVIKLGGEILHLVNASSRKEGFEIISNILNDGAALEKFEEMIRAQGVSARVAQQLCDRKGNVWDVLPRAKYVTPLLCPYSGYIHHIDALDLGKVALYLGAGRSKFDDAINYAVGLELLVQIGSRVYKGQAMIKVHHDQEELDESAIKYLSRAFVIKPEETIYHPNRVTEIITQH